MRATQHRSKSFEGRSKEQASREFGMADFRSIKRDRPRTLFDQFGSLKKKRNHPEKAVSTKSLKGRGFQNGKYFMSNVCLCQIDVYV